MSWRWAISFFDFRARRRRKFGRGDVDVAFVTNMRDETDRKRYLGNYVPKIGHFSGPKYWYNDEVSAATRSMVFTARELMDKKSRREAKESFLNIVRWSQDHGAKVILLAAGTKRLFGRGGRCLKEQFGDVTFTIGDNGTAYILKEETLRAFREAGLRPRFSRIAILGPSGILGGMMVSALKKEGYKIVAAGSSLSRLKVVAKREGIQMAESFDDMGKVDAVVSCTHSENLLLTKEKVGIIRKDDKKLLVIDVSEPSNLTETEYEKCRSMVVRQDAGNAYSPRLKYVLGPVSYRMFRLSKGVTFGCFAEAIALSKMPEDLRRSTNWFEVTEENMDIVASVFKELDISIPSPRNFGKPVTSFNLAFDPKEVDEADPCGELIGSFRIF